jgi:hypothetical protein
LAYAFGDAMAKQQVDEDGEAGVADAVKIGHPALFEPAPLRDAPRPIMASHAAIAQATMELSVLREAPSRARMDIPSMMLV